MLQSITYNCLGLSGGSICPCFVVWQHTPCKQVFTKAAMKPCNATGASRAVGSTLNSFWAFWLLCFQTPPFSACQFFSQPPWLQSSIVEGGRIYKNRERSQLQPSTFHSFGDRGANHPLGDSNYGPNSPLSPGNLGETLSDFLLSLVT